MHEELLHEAVHNGSTRRTRQNLMQIQAFCKSSSAAQRHSKLITSSSGIHFQWRDRSTGLNMHTHPEHRGVHVHSRCPFDPSKVRNLFIQLICPVNDGSSFFLSLFSSDKSASVRESGAGIWTGTVKIRLSVQKSTSFHYKEEQAVLG